MWETFKPTLCSLALVQALSFRRHQAVSDSQCSWVCFIVTSCPSPFLLKEPTFHWCSEQMHLCLEQSYGPASVTKNSNNLEAQSDYKGLSLSGITEESSWY